MIVLVRSVFLAVVLGQCLGCASLSTAHGGSNGLVYYLPKRILIVSVTMSAKDPKTGEAKPKPPSPDELIDKKPTVASVDVSVTDPFPDLSKKYVAKYNRNWMGQNSIKLVSSTTGLLTSADSTTVPKIKEALVAVGKAAGQMMTVALEKRQKPPPPPKCERHGQTYTKEIEILPKKYNETISPKLCGVTFEITKLGLTQGAKSSPGYKDSYGVFYRRDEPYLVKAKIGGDETIGVRTIMAPNNSPTEFLPITPSLFAKNTGNLKLTNGTATGYDEDVESEVAGLLEIPAGVIEAYFGAIGAIFKTRAEGVTQEEAYLKALHSLDRLEQVEQKTDATTLRTLLLENSRLQRCREAYRAGDAAAIGKECGN